MNSKLTLNPQNQEMCTATKHLQASRCGLWSQRIVGRMNSKSRPSSSAPKIFSRRSRR